MGGILVTTANPGLRDFGRVIRRIAEIADDLAYRKDGAPADAGQAGFLLSGYGMEAYERWAKAGQLLLVLKDDEPVAFCVVYPPSVAADDPGTHYIRAQYGEVPVIKQIATARGHERRGYSRLLYDYFAEQYPTLSVFAAIAEEPRNYGSESFHSKLGFAKCSIFSSHPDGRMRGIWRRPPINENR